MGAIDEGEAQDGMAEHELPGARELEEKCTLSRFVRPVIENQVLSARVAKSIGPLRMGALVPVINDRSSSGLADRAWRVDDLLHRTEQLVDSERLVENGLEAGLSRLHDRVSRIVPESGH